MEPRIIQKPGTLMKPGIRGIVGALKKRLRKKDPMEAGPAGAPPQGRKRPHFISALVLAGAISALAGFGGCYRVGPEGGGEKEVPGQAGGEDGKGSPGPGNDTEKGKERETDSGSGKETDGAGGTETDSGSSNDTDSGTGEEEDTGSEEDTQADTQGGEGPGTGEDTDTGGYGCEGDSGCKAGEKCVEHECREGECREWKYLEVEGPVERRPTHYVTDLSAGVRYWEAISADSETMATYADEGHPAHRPFTVAYDFSEKGGIPQYAGAGKDIADLTSIHQVAIVFSGIQWMIGGLEPGGELEIIEENASGVMDEGELLWAEGRTYGVRVDAVYCTPEQECYAEVAVLRMVRILNWSNNVLVCRAVLEPRHTSQLCGNEEMLVHTYKMGAGSGSAPGWAMFSILTSREILKDGGTLSDGRTEISLVWGENEEGSGTLMSITASVPECVE